MLETEVSRVPSIPPSSTDRGWGICQHLSFAVIAVYLYTLMEWVFFISKPSFMDLLSWQAKLQVLFVSTVPWVLIVVPVSFIGFWFGTILPRRWQHSGYCNLGVLGGAGILTVLTVLLIDNFTWTLFRKGIASTENYQPAVYLAAVLLGFTVSVLWFSRVSHTGNYRRILPWIAASCLLVSALFMLAGVYRGNSFGEQSRVVADHVLPNIVFFAADGVDAEDLLAYGSEKQLTPYLDTLLEESLVAASAFTNASRTTGATTAMLTGRYPTSTKVLFPPHVLIGENSFRHLPAILRGLGYRQSQESVRYYADSHDLNMRQAFNVANNRKITDPVTFMSPSLAMGLGSGIHFVEILVQRVVDRALHLTGARPMQRVYEAMTATTSTAVYGVTDSDRTSRVIEFILESDQPFFSHIHLMGTHCCEFRPEIRKFSAGHQQRTQANQGDYYYDAVLDSDRELERLVETLKTTGKWDNTILVYSSDHNREWGVRNRVPLIIRFPGASHNGVVKENSSLLDIAPTILAYLGIAKPEFMEGRSLLSGDLNPMEPLFSVGGMQREHFQSKTDRLSRLVGDGPPLYGLTTMVMIVCQRWYSLDTANGVLKQGLVRHHPHPCDGPFPDNDKARQLIKNHLNQRGFVLNDSNN